MEAAADVPVWDVIRMIATTRMVMPKSDVRLTAGRVKLDPTAQAMCFLAGANSIFSSETEFMLTKAVPSPSYTADKALLDALGMTMREAFKNGRPGEHHHEHPEGHTEGHDHSHPCGQTCTVA
jgi:biotin synthase